MVRALVALVALALLALAGLYLLGSGWLGSHWGAGTPGQAPVPAEVVARRAEAQREAAGGRSEVVLFGDLHVHTTYSLDAFLMSLPLNGGDGAHPVADACDFARHCAALDFWSINDHAIALTPRRWNETVAAIRQCNEVGDPANPDVTAFLGWEWTQIGNAPENHYGHRNVILRNQGEGEVPVRPIAATPTGPLSTRSDLSTLALGMLPLLTRDRPSLDFVRYVQDLTAVPVCPDGVPVRELPEECREFAATPRDLFDKLDEWHYDAMVIPHGTTWGLYTPLGSSWDKQLSRVGRDPERQPLIEIYSGHGNSEEYRDWREVEFREDGSRACPEPRDDYLPSCWRAGEVIRERCRAAGEADEVCAERAETARANYLDADISGHLTVPGAAPEEWLDSGQCRDCFLPSFNYRPRSSVQYIMALRDFSGLEGARFRFGFIGSSDVHSARPGTGYKEVSRVAMTESRFGSFARGPFGGRRAVAPEPVSRPFDASEGMSRFFGVRETERGASFFLTGGLVAVHAADRSRASIWDALSRKQVYGTSGPRILLWFDLLNPPAGGSLPMGSSVVMGEAPRFEVRAVGSAEQKPGCPDYAVRGLGGERLARLCRDECYHPSETRRLVTRIEVVRIRPRAAPDEPIAQLVEDPWRVLPCEPDPAGCSAQFSDPDFAGAARDALYYVRAVEAPSAAVNAANLRCEFDERGRCVRTRPCMDVPEDDDCLAEVEERAWSSPIFVDYAQ